ncbi:hypothetical protein [Streptomyces sp. SID3343]|uniref:hypothetical protein n=1 Tax=Streptomyces sp. SID3343 TaxID=2690260 RepID=UPI00136C48D2|nr:hypothetical protein [Streptomyces sp. SID3343]MYW03256.1 hypothetical protein [Streptomyces sp. SID3343]
MSSSSSSSASALTSAPESARGRAPVPGVVFAFGGLLVLVFVAAFVIGRLAGPVAPDLREPGPPGAPQPIGGEGKNKGKHTHNGLGPVPSLVVPRTTLGSMP